MRRLKERSGLTYRQLEERAAERGEVLARSTTADVLRRPALPRPDVVVAFVRACGCPPEDIHDWMAAHRRLADSQATGSQAIDSQAIGSQTAGPQAIGSQAVGPSEFRQAASLGVRAVARIPPTEAGTVPPVRAPHHVPRDLPDFTGREQEMSRLTAPVEGRAVVHAIDGMAGVGKTALAVHAGHLLADRFPDGRLFVDLQGYSEGKTPLTTDEALEILLGQLGIAASDGLEANWRVQTANARLLVILDNAVDEQQVAPLLPSGPGVTIVTSRSRLAGLAAARPLSLAVLPDQEAAAFFTRIVGADRVADEPAAVARIVQLCGGLPLALRLSGARLAHRTAWPVAHLSARLGDSRRRLPELSMAGQGVAVAFRMSYAQVPSEDKRVFHAMGLHPGADADAAVVAAMAGMSPDDADDALQRLVDVHLVEEAVPGRYRQHDLVRQYARSLSLDRQMVKRMLDHYLATATDATARLGTGTGPETATAHAWLTAERSNLLAATRCATAEGHSDYAWRLAVVLWRFLARNLAGDSIELLEQGVSAARETADGGELLLNTLLALAHWSAGHTSAAHELLAASAKSRGSTEFHAHALALLGLMLLRRGALDAAQEHAEQAFAELAELTALSPLGLDAKIITCWTRGVVRGLRGEHQAALPYLREAYASCAELGGLAPNDHVLTALARCLILLGDHDEAFGHLEQSLVVRRAIGDREGEAEALVLLGAVQRLRGNPEDAVRTQRSAVHMLHGDPRLQACARIELGATLTALGETATAIHEYEAALALAVQGRHSHERARALHQLAQTLRVDDPKTAERHQRRATEITTELGVQHETSLPHLRPAGW
ncbi:ATP-binding protein [Streptomyces sp. NPDC059785]|uniref:ATP-binding protein n=1 Tax=Streptomyces sp. NPDC059785 TaxID=3346945 RepID=UPI0036461EDC